MNKKYKHLVVKQILLLGVISFYAIPFVNAAEEPANFCLMREVTVSVTGYSSTFDQTDDSPFIAANGKFVHDGIVAANFLSFGTKIKIPEVFGEKVFTVEDRMNKKFQNRIDVWFPDRESALEFGHQTLKVQIYEL